MSFREKVSKIYSHGAPLKLEIKRLIQGFSTGGSPRGTVRAEVLKLFQPPSTFEIGNEMRSTKFYLEAINCI